VEEVGTVEGNVGGGDKGKENKEGKNRRKKLGERKESRSKEG
jgi:hypothetical protein